MDGRIQTLDKAINELAAPVLKEVGYQSEGVRTFRKISPSGKTCRIVDFQVGERFMSGRFTVNLAVYSEDFAPGPDRPSLADAREFDCLPDFRRRLGTLVRSRWTRFWTRLLGASESSSWRHILYGPRDRWWQFSGDEVITAASMESVLLTLQEAGFPWLAQMDDPERMEAQYGEITGRLEGRRHATS